jgi:hypothetical protein
MADRGRGGTKIAARNYVDAVQREHVMKRLVFVAAVISLSLSLSSVAAEAKGCIKGAIIGGIAGHYAGHGKVGVVAGCIIGRHEANKADAERERAATQRSHPAHTEDNRI